MWDQLAGLRRNRIAHRDLRLANLFLDDGDQAWIIDFGFSELAASDLLLRTDLAELLASLTTAIGVERAVAAGVAAVGPAAIADAADRLHPYTLSGATAPPSSIAPACSASWRPHQRRRRATHLRLAVVEEVAERGDHREQLLGQVHAQLLAGDPELGPLQRVEAEVVEAAVGPDGDQLAAEAQAVADPPDEGVEVERGRGRRRRNGPASRVRDRTTGSPVLSQSARWMANRCRSQ